jgi:hypothetical protein
VDVGGNGVNVGDGGRGVGDGGTSVGVAEGGAIVGDGGTAVGLGGPAVGDGGGAVWVGGAGADAEQAARALNRPHKASHAMTCIKERLRDLEQSGRIVASFDVENKRNISLQLLTVIVKRYLSGNTRHTFRDRPSDLFDRQNLLGRFSVL